MEEYHKISERLKKRMFRKIPFNTISDQFSSLAIDLQRTGQKHYTALSMLSAASCEISNKTPLKSAYFFVHAGRIFAQSALQDEHETQYFDAEEFVCEALDAFVQAANVYEQQNEFSMCSTLYYELGSTLEILKRYEVAGDYFMKSFHFASSHPTKPIPNSTEPSLRLSLGSQNQSTATRYSNQLMSTQVNSLKQAIHCYILTKDFELVTKTTDTLIQTIQQQLDQIQTQSNTFVSTQLNFHNATESLLQQHFVYTCIVHLIVLLIQKRNQEAKEALDTLVSWTHSNVDMDDDVDNYVNAARKKNENCFLIVQSRRKQGPQFAAFARDVLPLYQDLYEACIDNQVKFITLLIEEQLQHYAQQEQSSLLDMLRHVYENPLFMEAISTNQM
ncbi:hypothetical protein AKO1_002343 [Acrasis kona]|uniref:Uncharacterized protein n=1 Tax=Acrasis kona TaxID=1008807 RepID=A0AAW2YNK7_9EUKA